MNDWTAAGLAHSGFVGFVALVDLEAGSVPIDPGVYVVLRSTDDPPEFEPESPAGWFKDRNPSVSPAVLEQAWISGAQVVYIGKAGGKSGLRRRLNDYRRHGSGRRVGHWGGRFIWQLADRKELLVAWQTTPDVDPEVIESQLISEFAQTYGGRPFANRKLGKAPEVVRTATEQVR